jgi:hypothetical protein
MSEDELERLDNELSDALARTLEFLERQ